jgi:hypothetical protein
MREMIRETMREMTRETTKDHHSRTEVRIMSERIHMMRQMMREMMREVTRDGQNTDRSEQSRAHLRHCTRCYAYNSSFCL